MRARNRPKGQAHGPPARPRLGWLDLRPRRAGRRGAFLAFLAILDVLYGYSLLAGPQAPPVRAVYPLIPQHAWAWAWIAAGAVCASGVLAFEDRWQFAAAAAIKTGWALRAAWLWHLHVPLAWVSVVIWLCFAATVLVIASWPDPAAGTPPRRDAP